MLIYLNRLVVYCFQMLATLFCVISAQVGKVFGFFPDEPEGSCAECEDMARHGGLALMTDTAVDAESSGTALRLSGRII